MLKKAQVIMLSTQLNTCNLIPIIKYINDKLHYLNMEFTNNSIIGQHLYIISDDKIEEGDWFIVNRKIHKYDGSELPEILKVGYRKIIATTDTSLKITKSSTGYTETRSRTFYSEELLPQPSQQFIEKYIEEYNKGNIITDVLVEYTHYDEFGNYISGDIVRNNDILKLKINSKDNTITIKKLKYSWTREEVINLIKSFEKDIENSMDSDDDGNTFNNIDSNKWIKENL